MFASFVESEILRLNHVDFISMVFFEGKINSSHDEIAYFANT